ncbi:MAG: RNA polymerase sigma factor [Pirellulales bacterium]|nr:RNA polymerase sigma factor [Pirellulales bacterium]
MNSVPVPVLARVRAWFLWMMKDRDGKGRKRKGGSGAVLEIGMEAETEAAGRKQLDMDVAASLQGDGAAFARVIERYQQVIARRMARFARDRALIEELTHDVFVEAYFSLHTYRGDAPLEHWLQRIATRIGYRYWKRARRGDLVSLDRLALEPVAKTNDDGSLQRLEQSEAVARILERLPPRDRLVLTLLYVESRSVTEAADLAGWSPTMIKVQAYRARRKFRRLYDQLGFRETKDE